MPFSRENTYSIHWEPKREIDRQNVKQVKLDPSEAKAKDNKDDLQLLAVICNKYRVISSHRCESMLTEEGGKELLAKERGKKIVCVIVANISSNCSFMF